MSATSIHLAGFSEMTLQIYEIYRTIADGANFFRIFQCNTKIPGECRIKRSLGIYCE